MIRSGCGIHLPRDGGTTVLKANEKVFATDYIKGIMKAFRIPCK
jgi:hypothetical protein